MAETLPSIRGRALPSGKGGCSVGVLLAVVVLLLTASFCRCSTLVRDSELVDIHRFVVVGDIHGDADAFYQLLTEAELIKGGGKTSEGYNISWMPTWVPATASPETPVRTTLVQLGDLVDRGENDREAMNIAFSLFEQVAASKSKDEVVLLLGNHELLNLQGHYHYVNRPTFGGFLSKQMRDSAFSLDGPYGKFIAENLKLVHVDEGFVFVHAGFSSVPESANAEVINEKVRTALKGRDFRDPLLRSEGPVWTRQMIMKAMLDNCDDIRSVLNHFKGDRIVVGHTPQKSGKIEEYCEGKLVAADVGISRWMAGNRAMLEIVVLTRLNPKTGTLSKETSIAELRPGSPPRALSVRSTSSGKAAEETAAADAVLEGQICDDEDL